MQCSWCLQGVDTPFVKDGERVLCSPCGDFLHNKIMDARVARTNAWYAERNNASL